MSNEITRSIGDFLFIESQTLKPSDLTLVMGNDFLFTMNVVKQYIDDGVITGPIILTGNHAPGNNDPEPEAVKFFKRGLELGIPSEQMLLENKASNSKENLLFSRKLVEKRLGGFDGFNRITLIGKAFVLRRLQMTAAALGYPMEKLQYIGTVDEDGLNISKDTWYENDHARRRVFEELERIGKYAAKGDLAID